MLEQLLDVDPMVELLLEEASEEGYDLSIFKKFRFNVMQVFEIIQGMKSGVDYMKYASPLCNYMDMRVHRLKLESVRRE